MNCSAGIRGTRGSARGNAVRRIRGSSGVRLWPPSLPGPIHKWQRGAEKRPPRRHGGDVFHTVGIFRRRRLSEIVLKCTTTPTLPYFRTFRDPRGGGIVDRAMATDIRTYLPDDILAKVDRASMAYSLEARVPLLDHRIVEFAARLPLKHKAHGGGTKRLLRKILCRHVPRELIHRPENGVRHSGQPVGCAANCVRCSTSTLGKIASGGRDSSGRRGWGGSSGSTCRGAGTTSTACGRCWSSRCGWSATTRRPDPIHPCRGQTPRRSGQDHPQNHPPRYRAPRAAAHR